VLQLAEERVTVRELLRRRVYQEVAEFNARRPEQFRGLVQPSDAERTLNGYKVARGRRLDWEAQFAKAVAAFEGNGFVVLVGDRQIIELDAELDLRHDVEVTFIKLVPLVGG
jgi:hypothetical protein